MAKIDIETTSDYIGDIPDELRRIAKMIDEGYTSGYYPNWSIEGETDEPEE